MLEPFTPAIKLNFYILGLSLSGINGLGSVGKGSIVILGAVSSETLPHKKD